MVYNTEDPEVNKLGKAYSKKLNVVPYQTPDYKVTETGTIIHHNNVDYPLAIFGGHNLQNLMGAMNVGNKTFTMFKDFAHSPSKLKATTRAVKEQFNSRRVVACMELHTFSSLKKEFLPQYANAMDAADVAIVYFSPEVVKHKKLEPISSEQVSAGFGGNVIVMTETSKVLEFIREQDWNNSVLLMMSSGNFDGIDYEKLGEELIGK